MLRSLISLAVVFSAACPGSLRNTAFTLPMRTWGHQTGTGRSKAYLYFFSRVPPNPNSKYLGAYHAGEIVYVFNNLNRQNPLLQEAGGKLAEMMSDYWVKDQLDFIEQFQKRR